MSGTPLDLVELEQLVPGRSYDSAVQQLLAVVRTQLGMSCAWVSDFVGDQQVLRFVDALPGAPAPTAGAALPLSGSYCSRVLDGRFPTVIPDARRFPEAALLDVTVELGIGAYVGVPLIGPAGTATGMLCVVDEGPVPALSERDAAALRLVAGLLRDLQERAVHEAELVAERTAVEQALRAVVAGHGRHAVLQPVVEIATGRVVGAEGLTRFTATDPHRDVLRGPAQWFDDAARLGMRDELELATAVSVLDLLDEVPPHVSLAVNLGPSVLLGPDLAGLLRGRALHRVVVELTEHAPVTDYAALSGALRPWREQGVRIAVDDAGAGYASLRHVLAVRPDTVKVDMALVRGLDEDPVRQALLRAVAGFCRDHGIRVVAEGVETPAELAAVAACGLDFAQGYLLARPSTAPDWERVVRARGGAAARRCPRGGRSRPAARCAGPARP